MNRNELMQLALEEAAGAVIVLDERLKIVERTSLAEELVGSALPLGALASKVMCGEAGERPIAEALAEGRATTGRLPRITPDGGARMLRVRAVPLADPIRGWMLLLEAETGGTLTEGSVNFHGILTADGKMKALLADLVKVAQADSSVLVRGETGSGKELVAHAVHLESGRAKGPFRAINCAALPAQLLESELFGHVRGAFTGAIRDYEGHFRLAHKGTLFLDEVAELPLDLQAKLLRVLQERSVLPIGGREPIPVDVRVVAATHRSLRSEVAAGRFRADLMYRLRVIPLFLPPLRERPADVGLLSRHFVAQWNERSVRQVNHVSAGALRALEAYDWPGNVRELQNAIEYAFVMGSGAVLTEAELPPELNGVGVLGPPSLNVAAPPDAELPTEARRLVQALERAGGSRERAAQSLGISRTTLWRKLRRYGLASDESGS